jgi:hypothetical protein
MLATAYFASSLKVQDSVLLVALSNLRQRKVELVSRKQYAQKSASMDPLREGRLQTGQPAQCQESRWRASFGSRHNGRCDMTPTSTLSAKEVRGASPLVAIDNEAPAKLIVDPPLADQLARGAVFIQYRTENLRVAPVFGHGALEVSPRVGHIHVTVDDARWHFIDASGETVVVVGLPAGEHMVLIELADPIHRVIASETVRFSIPKQPVASSS